MEKKKLSQKSIIQITTNPIQMTEQIELNKIYCESNLETMAKMPDCFVDLTVTSPPYDNLRTYNDNIDETWGEDVWKPIIKELYRVTKVGGVVVWVVGDATINGSETGVSFQQALWAMECGFRLHDTMIYHRPSPNPPNVRYYQEYEYMFVLSKGSPNIFNAILQPKSINTNKVDKKSINKNRRKKNGDITELDDKAVERFIKCRDKESRIKSNIWYVPAGYMVSSQDKDAFNHPAIFPENLAKDHIKSWSNEGDLVYDPFMGSGTTAKMAHLLKRKWIGSEISQEYVDLSYKRLEPYLTQQTLF